MRKLFITTMALIIGLTFTAGAFAEMEGMTGTAPAEKETPKMSETKESHESKAVHSKSSSTKKKMKKGHKGKKAKKESAPSEPAPAN